MNEAVITPKKYHDMCEPYIKKLIIPKPCLVMVWGFALCSDEHAISLKDGIGEVVHGA